MITYILIGITVVVSLLAFNDYKLKNRLMFSPFAIVKSGQYERFITSGFIHSNLTHLFFNMFVLWSFGQYIEQAFLVWFGNLGNLYYVLLYFGALIFSSLPSWFRHQNNSYYKALGASGAVSAVVFAYVLISPLNKIGLLFIPIGIPAVIMGVLYLAYEFYADAQVNDNIGHAAHAYGAIFGFTFPIIFNYRLIFSFFDQIMSVFL